MTEILMRILNIAERVRGMEQLSRVAAVAFAVLFIFGFLNCILGYRILRFWMMLFGFGMGAGLGLAAAYSVGVEDKMTYLIVMAATGIVLAVVSFLIYRAGIFILGAGIGMALSIYVLHPTTSAVFFSAS